MASIYNKQNLTVDNLTVTGNANIGGSVEAGGRMRGSYFQPNKSTNHPQDLEPRFYKEDGYTYISGNTGFKAHSWHNNRSNTIGINAAIGSLQNVKELKDSVTIKGNLVVENIYPNESISNSNRFVKFNDTLRVKGDGMIERMTINGD